MMDKKLSEILSKIVETKNYEALAQTERDYLSSLVKKHEVQETEEKPLWSLIRKQFIRWEPLFLNQYAWNLRDYEDNVKTILRGAGVDIPESGSPLALYLIKVKKEDLQKSIRRFLLIDDNESSYVKHTAAHLMGLLEMRELAPALIECIKDNLSGKKSWDEDAIIYSLRSLFILHIPVTEIALACAKKYSNHSYSRNIASLCALQHPLEDLDALAPVLETKESYYYTADFDCLASHPENVAKVMHSNKALRDKMLELTLESGDVPLEFSLIVASVIVKDKLKKSVTKLLESSCSNLRGAFALELCWSEDSWAFNALKERLESGAEGDSGVLACMVTALATLKDKEKFLAEKLASDNSPEQIGAIWACLNNTEHDARLKELLSTGSDNVQCAAALVLTLNGSLGGCSEELLWTLTDRLIEKEGDSWAVRLAIKGLRVAKQNNLVPVLEYLFDNGPWSVSSVDQLLAFYRQDPTRMQYSYRGPRAWKMTTQALSGVHPMLREEAEADLLYTIEESADLERVLLELQCLGGPQSPMARLMSTLLLTRDDARLQLTEDELIPAIVVALRAEESLRIRAIRALASFGRRIDPLLSLLLMRDDSDSIKNAISAAVVQIEDPSEPALEDLYTTYSSDGRFDDIKMPGWCSYFMTSEQKTRLADLASQPGGDSAKSKRCLLEWLNSDSSSVVNAALKGIAAQNKEQPWCKTLLLEKSYNDDWEIRQEAVRLLSETPDALVIQRLTAMMSDDDTDVQNTAIEAFRKVAESRPELGLFVLDIREPDKVNTAYQMSEDYNYEPDSRVEALRILLIALDRRKESSLARRHAGKKILFSKLSKDRELTEGARAVSTKELEGLALYLRVTFTDEEDGSIVAEVGKEPMGEVINALLQTDSLIVTSAVWS